MVGGADGSSMPATEAAASMAAAAASVAVVMAMAAAAATMAMARRWWWCGVDGSSPDFGDVKYDGESFGNGASSSAAGLRTAHASSKS